MNSRTRRSDLIQRAFNTMGRQYGINFCRYSEQAICLRRRRTYLSQHQDLNNDKVTIKPSQLRTDSLPRPNPLNIKITGTSLFKQEFRLTTNRRSHTFFSARIPNSDIRSPTRIIWLDNRRLRGFGTPLGNRAKSATSNKILIESHD